MRTMWLGLVFVAACTGKEDDPVDTAPVVIDEDADGYDTSADCDDSDANVHPDAEETWYDGVDTDCDGWDDYDQDHDGVRGDEGGLDCDDSSAAVYTGAAELCDEVDNDCDGETDEAALDAFTLYADSDSDGFGAGDPLGLSCDAPQAGQAAQAGDCDDGDAEIRPDAVETCDGVDQDCNGSIDDDAADAPPWFADFDRDGFGLASSEARSCQQPVAYVADSTDCDDSDDLSFPGGVETCDGHDNDCDGAVDDDAPDARIWFEDSDHDGVGTPIITLTACLPPEGYAGADTDCDDADPTVNPRALETCDGIDEDCDGEIDNHATDALAWYPDADLDGFGATATAVTTCSPDAGWISTGGDCDDASSVVHPDGAEVCGGGDEDCDGAIDELGASGGTDFFLDIDGDGYGVADTTLNACNLPTGYAPNDTDCNDAVAAANPGARERCDSIDNDCDRVVDEEDAYDVRTFYYDADSDGYGAVGTTTVGCDAPLGYAAAADDCNDADSSVNPAATETLDLVDEDCDTLVDENFRAAGDIVVTEIARQPYKGGGGRSTNANAQWFEVYNPGAAAIDMSGWYIEEQVGDFFYIDPDAALVVPAGGYAVLCYDDVAFSSPSQCDYTWGDTALGVNQYGLPQFDTTYYFDRDEDLVALYVDGNLIDQVAWNLLPGTGGSNWPRTARYSMRLDDDGLDTVSNDQAGAWCLSPNLPYVSYTAGGLSLSDYGSPGAANGSCD